MTFLGTEMTWFGWFALFLESVVIWTKDAYLWKESIQFRDFVDEKTGLVILWIYYYGSVLASEIGWIIEKKNIISGILLFILCIMVYYLTENGTEVVGRINISWVFFYQIGLFLGRLAGIPALQEGKISYYENPAEIFPNLILMCIVLCVLKRVYRKKILDKVLPASICSIWVWMYAFNSFILWIDIKEDGVISLKRVLLLIGALILVNGLYVVILFFDSRKKRRMLELEEQCREQFYRQMKLVQQNAGKFRHDLANHLQIIEKYHQQGLVGEMQKYALKLEDRRTELELAFYTEDPVMNFCFNQVQKLAENRGICLAIDCPIEEIAFTEDDRERVIGQCLNILAHCKKRTAFLCLGILRREDGSVECRVLTALKCRKADGGYRYWQREVR